LVGFAYFICCSWSNPNITLPKLRKINLGIILSRIKFVF
jgi:hypothetical protein